MNTQSPDLGLTSLGRSLNTDESQFGFIRSSNDLLDDPEQMRQRLAEDGYLYLKEFLDPDLIAEARRSVLTRLRLDGLLDGNRDIMEGVVDSSHLEDFALNTAPQFASSRNLKRMKTGAFRPDLAVANAEIERVVYGPEIHEFYDKLFGEPALHFDYTWLRVMGPGAGTPTHCDWVYMGRGSTELLTCWIPYGRIPLHVGGLILLEQSHLKADRIASYLAKDVDSYCENDPEEVQKVKVDGGWSFPGWLSNHPDTLPEKFESRWLTCECWEPGDFITFNMRLTHGSLDNHSDRIRISTDVRYQPASHAVDERWVGENPPGHSTAGKRGRIC